MRQSRSNPLVHTGLALFVFLWLLPSLGLFISSLRTRAAMNDSGWWSALLNPLSLTISNYIDVVTTGGLGRAFINSIIISVPATILPILIAAGAAYAFQFFRFPFRRTLFITCIGLQVIPLQVTLIPVLRMYNMTGLSGTWPAVWLAHTAFGLPFGIFLLRNFFANVPYSLIESARIDGASEASIFFRLILPLAVPALASLGIFQFLWTWNDLLIALVFLGGTSETAPLTVKITSMFGSLESGWHIMASASFISMALPLLIFFSLQRYFVKGILAGSIKQ
jgi:alpha-glucoside transport system permease protein